jgi:hypothetical protein
MHSHVGVKKSTEAMTTSLYDTLDPAFLAVGAFAKIRGYENYRPQHGRKNADLERIAPHLILASLAPKGQSTGDFSKLGIELVASSELPPSTFGRLSPSTEAHPQVSNSLLAFQITGLLRSAGEVACGVSIFAYEGSVYDGETQAFFGTRVASMSAQVRAAAERANQNKEEALKRTKHGIDYPLLGGFETGR